MLSLPNIQAHIRKTNSGEEIFDPVRKKYVCLTPEEWVRQHWIEYLQQHLGVPRSWIAVEYGFQLNGTFKRCDLMVCNKKGEALLIVECKAPHVQINRNVFEQISRYNLVLKAPFLIVSNGVQHHAMRISFDTNQSEFLQDIPSYQEMLQFKNF